MAEEKRVKKSIQKIVCRCGNKEFRRIGDESTSTRYTHRGNFRDGSGKYKCHNCGAIALSDLVV